MTPREKITDPPIDEVYRSQLLPYEFPKMSLSIPEGSLAVQERIQKIYYYKKTKRQQKGTLLYLLHEKPDYFVNLFPTLTQQCILDDYEFIKRTMNANLNSIQGITDAFFIIMKGVRVVRKEFAVVESVLPDGVWLRSEPHGYPLWRPMQVFGKTWTCATRAKRKGTRR